MSPPPRFPSRRARFFSVTFAASTLTLYSGIASAADTKADAKPDAKQACASAADRGQTRRDEGKYTEAREALVRCSANDCPKIVSQACGRWLRDLDDAMPSFVVGAQDEAGHDLTSVAVALDGTSIATTLDGQPHTADPGAHTLRLEARDRTPVEQRIVLRSGEKNRVFVVPLPRLGQASESGEPAQTTGPAAPSGDGLQPRTVVGFSLTAVAVAAAAVGGYFIAQSLSESSHASDLRNAFPTSSTCAQSTSADCTALSDAVDAHHRDATMGGVFLGAAGVFALSAVATFVFWSPAKQAPESDAPDTAAWSFVPSFTPHDVTLGIRRSFL